MNDIYIAVQTKKVFSEFYREVFVYHNHDYNIEVFGLPHGYVFECLNDIITELHKFKKFFDI